MSAPGRGFIVAAPHSGSGKTIVTMGLIAALRGRGLAVAAAKAGPDYIDTAFLAAAAGRPAINLDPWAMSPARLAALAGMAAGGADLLIVEGAMGLFDGSDAGAGSTAHLARRLGLPVLLVVDAGGTAQTAAAVAAGLAGFDESINVVGAIAARVAGPRHEALLREGFSATGVKLLGAVPRQAGLVLASRHLGLVPAGETMGLASTIASAGATIEAHVDLDAILRLGGSIAPAPDLSQPPPGQRIALASDAAFGFAYQHLLAGWRRAGAEIIAFSPLADEAPDAAADAVFLPGGYPELHAGRLAGAKTFLAGLAGAARRGAFVHGECGGYMVLGAGLVDGEGRRHAMAGLLGLETSFADRRLHLGYRIGTLLADCAFGRAGTRLAGHEFHHASVLAERGEALLTLTDTRGRDLGRAGLSDGRISGSFVHLIDHAAAD